jgi:hypothetical protein
VRTASFRQRESRRVDIDFQVVIANLIFVTVPSDVVRNIRPRAQPIDLCAFQEQELFIGTPLSVEDGEGVLLDDAKRMCCWLMGVAGGAAGEALDAEVIFVAGRVCAPYPDLFGRLLLGHVQH